MRWFRKPAESKDTPVAAGVIPEPLAVTFDAEILETKLGSLRAAIDEAGGVEGLEPFIEALRSKHEVFAAVAAKGADVTSADLRALAGLVFSIRRKLGPLLAQREGALLRGLREVLAPDGLSLDDRLQGFADIAGEDKKLRRGLWDFAAELLHFSDPEHLPLANRWVWDTATTTGALREFIRGNDTLRQIPIGGSLGAIAGARQWFYEALASQGFYRDLPFVTDLVWAQAYSDYARSLSMGMGMIDAQFGAKQDPLELVIKILGIDAPAGRLKAVRDETLH